MSHNAIITDLNELPIKQTQQDSDFFNIRSPEMYVNMKPKDIPPFDSAEFIPFGREEKRKVQEGVNINGEFICGNLYYHLNFHTLQIDTFNQKTKRIDRPATRAPLRDNEWIIHNRYHDAYLEKKLYMIGGSRQISKSDSIVSLTCRELFCFQGAEVMGLFSISEDKDTFNKKLQVALSDGEETIELARQYFPDSPRPDTHPNFLILPNIDKDLSKKYIRFGITQKDNEPLVFSKLYTYLTKEGLATQVGAGKSLTFFFYEEIAKAPMRAVWEAVKPALWSEFGYRCASFMAFTGGNVEKSEDALNMFFSPKANDVLEFENEGVKTGMFMGGWYRQGYKYKTNLAKYLGKPEEGELAQIPIQVTDFDLANERLDEEIAAKKEDKDPNAVVQHRMFYPRTLKEMSLTAKESPFKKFEDDLKRQKDFLLESKPGRRVRLHKINGEVVITDADTDADIYNFPHNSTDNLNAPVVIYEEPKFKGAYKLYISGMDPYNITMTNTSPSLGAFYLMKRKYGSLTDPYQDTMVCKYVARPTDTINTFLETIQLILELYDATMLYEVSNDNVLPFFDKQHIAELYLAKSHTLQKTINPKSSSLNSYGLTATPRNQRFWMNCVIEYLSEVIGIDQHGRPILGLTRILDPLLIDEMLAWKEDLNVDRIVGFGHMLALRDHLDKFEKPQVDPEEKEEKPKVNLHRRNPWGMGKSDSKYSQKKKRSVFKL